MENLCIQNAKGSGRQNDLVWQAWQLPACLRIVVVFKASTTRGRQYKPQIVSNCTCQWLPWWTRKKVLPSSWVINTTLLCFPLPLDSSGLVAWSNRLMGEGVKLPFSVLWSIFFASFLLLIILWLPFPWIYTRGALVHWVRLRKTSSSLKVIPFNCIAHPFCAMLFTW